MKTRMIKADYLARVEGEGAMYIKIKDNKLQDVEFNIFEPPRFFEAFLKGRRLEEAPDITARICGICPIAYQMSSVHAMENALGVTVDGQLRELRRLLYCGEWIESHALHIFMLHAPDFLGYQDAIQMAADHGELVNQALKLKKIGNDLVTILGGREIHPISVRVGGFYRVPEKKELEVILDDLEWGMKTAMETTKVLATLPMPDFERDYEFVSLKNPDEYPLCGGRLVSNKGLDIAIEEYEDHFVEEHVKHANALHSIMPERGEYFVGPLARYNNCYDQLSKNALKTVKLAGLGKTCNNPFKSILVRAVELVYAYEEAIRIIKQYERPKKPYVNYNPKKSTGMGCSEAPRGILFHRYNLSVDGLIEGAKITPPTSQNQKIIESDLRNFVPAHIDLSDEDLTWKCEQAIRNYDPCISCATHFLKLKVDRV